MKNTTTRDSVRKVETDRGSRNQKGQPASLAVTYLFDCLHKALKAHLSRMNFPVSIDRTSLFKIVGVFWVVFFHFYSNSNRTFCEQTVEILI